MLLNNLLIFLRPNNLIFFVDIAVEVTGIKW
jgi:hypothetical protein